MVFRFRVKQAAAALAVAALTVGAGSARAAVYSGTWDPAFGGIFTDLGWKGSATFIVPDACLGLSGSFANSSLGCGGDGMQVLDARIDFYDRTTDPTGLHVLETLKVGDAPIVNGMTFATLAGVTSLLGADTGFFEGMKGSIPEAEFNGHDYYFHLILHGDQAALFYTLNANDSPGCATPAFGLPDPSKCGFSATPAHIVFTAAIPEPTTWALFGIGLAALWSLRRRAKLTPTARAVAA